MQLAKCVLHVAGEQDGSRSVSEETRLPASTGFISLPGVGDCQFQITTPLVNLYISQSASPAWRQNGEQKYEVEQHEVET